MKCWYCARPVFRERVCFTHWLRWMRTVYGDEAARAALKRNAATATTATA